MKALFTLGLSLFLAAGAMAADSAKTATTSTTTTVATNTVCPVSGDKVGSMGKPYIVEYKGQKIALCCKDCTKDFKKHPAKYAALAAKNTSDKSGTSMKK
jgi:YHS domain-containing protein